MLPGISPLRSQGWRVTRIVGRYTYAASRAMPTPPSLLCISSGPGPCSLNKVRIPSENYRPTAFTVGGSDMLIGLNLLYPRMSDYTQQRYAEMLAFQIHRGSVVTACSGERRHKIIRRSDEQPFINIGSYIQWKSKTNTHADFCIFTNYWKFGVTAGWLQTAV